MKKRTLTFDELVEAQLLTFQKMPSDELKVLIEESESFNTIIAMYRDMLSWSDKGFKGEFYVTMYAAIANRELVDYQKTMENIRLTLELVDGVWKH